MINCPLCGQSPKVEYACGEYFVWCSDECKSPACFHSSEEQAVREWDSWAEGVMTPVIVSDIGLVHIRKSVRDLAGIAPGDKVIIRASDGRVVVEKV